MIYKIRNISFASLIKENLCNKYGFCFTSSYMPPIIQSHLDPDQESMVFMPEFGHHVNERKLLIV